MKLLRRRLSRRSRLGRLVTREIVLALGVDVAVDQLDHGTRSRIAVPEPGLQHAGIAAVAVLVARADHLEELLDGVDVAHFRDRLPASVEIAALAERNQLLDDRTEILGL